jgi:hypothetical protein
VAWFARFAAAARGADAPAYHAVMVLASGVLLDPRFRVSPGARERAQQRTAARAADVTGPGAGWIRPSRRPRPPRLRRERLRGAGPAAVAGALGLAAVAGVGVGTGTAPVQGVLTTLVLLAAGLCLAVGLARPGTRGANAALGAFAGGWLGLAAAVLVGGVGWLVAGPSAGWTGFWSAWVTTIVLATTLGAAE